MQILIMLDRRDPPAGRVALPATADEGRGEPPVVFVGWLGLLRALYEVVSRPAR